MITQSGHKYVYHKRNESESKSIWRCYRYSGSRFQAKCKARCWTIGTNITKFINEHNHLPNNADFEGIEITPHGNAVEHDSKDEIEPIGHYIDVE